MTFSNKKLKTFSPLAKLLSLSVQLSIAKVSETKLTNAANVKFNRSRFNELICVFHRCGFRRYQVARSDQNVTHWVSFKALPFSLPFRMELEIGLRILIDKSDRVLRTALLNLTTRAALRLFTQKGVEYCENVCWTGSENELQLLVNA